MYAHALQLAESLKGNTSLKVLDIAANNIGPEGIKVLLEALRGNNTLRNLELGYNPIGEEGAKHLADVVKYDLAVGFLSEYSWSHPHAAVCDLLRWPSRKFCVMVTSCNSYIAGFTAANLGLQQQRTGSIVS